MKDLILFATTDCEEGRAEAREYIKRFGFTGDDVHLVSREGQVLVVDKGGAFDRMEERAAIKEYDGGMSREEAEKQTKKEYGI